MLVYFALHSTANTLPDDFRREFWPAAHRLLNGVNPYSRTWQNINAGVAFPYPALTAVAFVPLALVPHNITDVAFLVLGLASIPATLKVLGVRDPRVYGIVLLWAPVVAAWQSENLTLLLALGIACVWRVRDRPLVAGLLVAAMISLKPFIWPIGIWLILTRRWTAARYAATAAVVLNLAAWGVVGFAQIDSYRRLTAAVATAMSRRSYTILNLGLGVGLGHAVAYAIAVLVAAGIGAWCLLAVRRRDQRLLLALCLALAMLATPVIWSHYFTLMLIPLALYRPRLTWLWFLPVVLWLCPAGTPATWQIALLLTVNAVLIAAVTRRPSDGHPRLQIALRPALSASRG
jgi:hypothetical protein